MVSIEWLAGFIDGEGCLFIVGNKRTRHALILAIANIHLPTLKAIQEIFGGHIQALSTRRGRQIYEIRWHGKTALELIKQLEPHLITKRDQAQFIIENWQLGPRHILTEADKTHREFVKTRLQSLKRIEFPVN